MWVVFKGLTSKKASKIRNLNILSWATERKATYLTAQHNKKKIQSALQKLEKCKKIRNFPIKIKQGQCQKCSGGIPKYIKNLEKEKFNREYEEDNVSVLQIENTQANERKFTRFPSVLFDFNVCLLFYLLLNCCGCHIGGKFLFSISNKQTNLYNTKI